MPKRKVALIVLYCNALSLFQRHSILSPDIPHIDDWHLSMKAKGCGESHTRGFVGNLHRVVTGCKWRYLSDIKASDLALWSNGLKGTKSLGTINHHLRAAKAFCRWLVLGKRITENPLLQVALLNADTDRRYERHPFTLDELGKLLATAECGSVVNGMAGEDRALLYRTAVETGFRWSELHSLKRSSFDFKAVPATVTIAAAYAKNRKSDTLPLRSELATDLQTRMALFLPEAKAFSGMWKAKGADMIRADLEAGGVLSRNDNKLIVKDEYGLVYDFHSLRHTFATMLNKAKVPLATAQKLMRHSNPKLTANIYTHILVSDKAEELAKLPVISAKTPPKENRNFSL